MIAYYPLFSRLCGIALLASIPMMLIIRTRRPDRMPWWLMIILSAAIGWMASNCYAYVENLQVEAQDREALRQGTIGDFWRATVQSQTLSWGWTVGLAYLVFCCSLYFPLRSAVSRPVWRVLMALLVAVCGLAFGTSSFFTPVAVIFIAFYTTFLICAGLSFQIVRKLRLQRPWHPFVVMFCVTPLCIVCLAALAVTVSVLLGPKIPADLPLPLY